MRRRRLLRHFFLRGLGWVGWMAILGVGGVAGAAVGGAWTEGDGFRSRPLRVGQADRATAGFTLLEPSSTGVGFTNVLAGDAFLTNLVAHNGAGVALGDIDGDGLPDLYLCGLQSANRLYRNRGDWRFEQRDPGPAACANQFSTGATFADVDGDADLDLLVNGIAAGTRLFLNDGTGRFQEAEGTGLSRTASSTSLTLADVDGDGDLDLYCAHYIDVMHLADPTTRFALAQRDGAWVVLKVNGESAQSAKWKGRFEALADGSVRELPEVHGLYRNEGQGRFKAIQFEPGVFMGEDGTPMAPPRDWGLAAMFRDWTGDGAPDLWVCNDNASPDRVWVNTGRGTFRAIETRKIRHTSRSSMGLAMGDIDRDGRDDVFVVDMLAREHARRMRQLVRERPGLAEAERVEARPRYNRNTLFLGQADGSFVETALMAGVAASDWSWCPMLVDVDLDGFEDLLVTNGFDMDVMDQDSVDRLGQRQRQMRVEDRKRSRQSHPSFRTRNAAFRNRGDGTFVSVDGGWGFGREGVSHGAAMADLDGDGDLDVVVNNLNGVVSLYRNDASAARIAVRLKGGAANSQGIGARVRLISGAFVQATEMGCGGRYMSGDDAIRVFAAPGSPGGEHRLEVRWRDGARSDLAGVLPDRMYEVRHPGSEASQLAASEPVPQTVFEDVSSRLGHAHPEDAFSDWEHQALLPRRLSRMGPGVSWYDLDGDGNEDLLVAAARGAVPGIFLGDGRGGFRKVPGLAGGRGDQSALVGWADGHGGRKILAAVSNHESSPGTEALLVTYSVTNGGAATAQPAGLAVPGAIALADVDGDGDLDLFLAGRGLPGRYPEPASSSLWLNQEGRLERDAAGSAVFGALGLVRGAAFGDLDGDGDSDLVVALEWGAIRVFLNDGRRLVDVSDPWGTAARRGWWTGVALGDFDGDGRLDIAAGNWGRNSAYELNLPGSLRIYYGDREGDGRLEILEAFREGTAWRPVRSRTDMAAGFPDLVQRFPNHEAYGRAVVSEVIGSSGEAFRYLEADHFEAGVYLNRGGRFEWRAFPPQAQRSPSFSLPVGDLDGDGIEDVVLSQNFFGSASDLSRDDGGCGLWLQGLGDGGFRAVDPSRSGIAVDGEQRGAALADFDQDGRVDLVIGQNNASTRVFRNRGGRPGLRVILEGERSNPEGIGALLRVEYAEGERGPSRLVSAGSGWGSQNGAVQVLGLKAAPIAVWVRWPGGVEEKVPVTESHREVRIRHRQRGP